MIKDEIDALLNEYYHWLKDKTIVTQIGSEWVEISTPHLDRHNDYLQIYIRKDNNRFVLTDDGYIISDLFDSGCPLDRPKRQELLNVTLAGFGVQRQGNALVVEATQEDFPLKKHSLVQAMLAINDIFYLAKPYVENLFFEDVVNWLDLSNIRYTPRIKFSGRIGYDHLFDFVIPKSRVQGERIVQTISNPNKDNAESLVFRWQDTKENRSNDSTLFALLNDTEKGVTATITSAFKNYGVTPVLWSERDSFRERLAA